MNSYVGDPAVRDAWDERYRERSQLWSGRPNGALVAEVSDLPPGKSGSLNIRLTPGTYLLICNQPNHYKAGMWTKLTVTR